MKAATFIKLKWIPAAILAGGLAVLFFFNPAEHRFFPACLFHQLTGWHCPGCGATRAAHELMHGNFAVAFRDNAFLVGAVLGAGLLLPIYWIRRRRGQAAAWNLRAEWLWLLLGGLLVFGVWRNLPAGAWLAP